MSTTRECDHLITSTCGLGLAYSYDHNPVGVKVEDGSIAAPSLVENPQPLSPEKSKNYDFFHNIIYALEH